MSIISEKLLEENMAFLQSELLNVTTISRKQKLLGTLVSVGFFCRFVIPHTLKLSAAKMNRKASLSH